MYRLILFEFSLIFFVFRLIIVKNGVITLATLLDIKPPTLSIKIKRDNFSESDLKKIADVLGYEYEAVFTDKNTGKKI